MGFFTNGIGGAFCILWEGRVGQRNTSFCFFWLIFSKSKLQNNHQHLKILINFVNFFDVRALKFSGIFAPQVNISAWKVSIVARIFSTATLNHVCFSRFFRRLKHSKEDWLRQISMNDRAKFWNVAIVIVTYGAKGISFLSQITLAFF